MQTRTPLTAVSLLAAGALLGWLAASGRLNTALRADDKAEAEKKAPGGFPTPDEVQRRMALP